MLRSGYLSDENVRKRCGMTQPIPMDRIDLLPRPMENRSGLYSRPLKTPQILSRPATAGVMIQATEKLTGRDLSIDFKMALEQDPPPYPKTLPRSQRIPTPIHGNAYHPGTALADITYAQMAAIHGIPHGSDVLSTTPSDIDIEAVSVATPTDVSDTLSERDARLEMMRQLGYQDPLDIGAAATRMPAAPQVSTEPVVQPPRQGVVQTLQRPQEEEMPRPGMVQGIVNLFN